MRGLKYLNMLKHTWILTVAWQTTGLILPDILNVSTCRFYHTDPVYTSGRFLIKLSNIIFLLSWKNLNQNENGKKIWKKSNSETGENNAKTILNNFLKHMDKKYFVFNIMIHHDPFCKMYFYPYQAHSICDFTQLFFCLFAFFLKLIKDKITTFPSSLTVSLFLCFS